MIADKKLDISAGFWYTTPVTIEKGKI